MATFRVLLSGLQQLWDECQEVRESTPCYCLQRFCLGIQLLLKLFSSRDGGPTDLATKGEETARQEGEDQEEGGTGRMPGR